MFESISTTIIHIIMDETEEAYYETMNHEMEVASLEPEADIDDDDESFSNLPNLVDISGNIPLTSWPRIVTVIINTGYDSNDDDDSFKMCHICFENKPQDKMVYFKERFMVGHRCCMQNFMCGDCLMNNVRHNLRKSILCPFCRNPVTEIETYDLTFARTLEEIFRQRPN